MRYVAFVLLLSTLSFGQQVYHLSNKQFSRFMSIHNRIQDIDTQINRLRAAQVNLYTQLAEECRNTANENGWGADVQCDFQSGTFYAKPAPPPPPPAPAPAPAVAPAPAPAPTTVPVAAPKAETKIGTPVQHETPHEESK